MTSSTAELEDAFTRIGQYEGAHQILDTRWEYFLEDFKGFDISARLDAISQKSGTIAVLDEGCGSSLTLFEAIEDIEKRKGSAGEVLGYGLTASTDYLAQPAPDHLKEKVLKSDSTTPENRNRVELLLGGVSVDAANGYHRYTPQGNLIRIIKTDVHSLDRVFPEQKFDLIYSSSAYPHFSNPRLAFEKSIAALNGGGLLLIDALSTDDCSPDYLRKLQEEHSEYTITTIDIDNPFYQAVAVERSKQE